MPTEANENVETAYYFPLRNEKNVQFLEKHQSYLENLMQKYFGRVDKNEMINDTLRAKYTAIKKDIQILQTRLISIKKVFENATHAERNAEMASYNAANIQSNVHLKLQLINNMKMEYNTEYDRFYEKYHAEDSRKVKTYYQEQDDRRGPHECCQASNRSR